MTYRYFKNGQEIKPADLNKREITEKVASALHLVRKEKTQNEK